MVYRLSAHYTGEIKIWDTTTGNLTRRHAAADTPAAVVFTPDGADLVFAVGRARAGRVEVLNMTTARVRDAFDDAAIFGPSGQLLAISPDGKWLATCGTGDAGARSNPAGRPGTVRVRDSVTAGERDRFRNNWDEGTFRAVAFSPDGKSLAVGGGQPDDGRPNWGAVRVFDVPSGQRRLNLIGHKRITESLAWSPDGRTLISGGMDGTLIFWEVASGKQRKCVRPARRLAARILSLSASKAGNVLAVGIGSWNRGNRWGEVQLWALDDLARLAILGPYPSPITSTALSLQGGSLAAGDGDGTVRVWDMEKVLEASKAR
jgi:WD40 repeat protein